ncbi:MAG: hypothetical protein VYA97_00490, partial [Pseudomonadota bacterium]|nr:hypothetical protein [Pseudomonadota bacterium]
TRSGQSSAQGATSIAPASSKTIKRRLFSGVFTRNEGTEEVGRPVITAPKKDKMPPIRRHQG